MAKGIDWDVQIGRRLRLRDLHTFSSVVRAGSMAKAAAELGVSQPAVSKVVADLEHAVGVRLLERTRKGVTPTSYGEAVLRRSGAAFDELKQLVRDIESLADPETGQVTIACADSTAASVLLPIIDRFRARHPRVILQVDTAASPVFDDPGLRSRKYDLVLARQPTNLAELPDHLNAIVLFHDRPVVVAGRQTPWVRRRRIELAELVDEPWILAPAESWTHTWLAAAFRAKALRMPEVTLTTYSLTLMAHFLVTGPGISVFPQSVVGLHPACSALKALPVDVPVLNWPVAILTLKERMPSAVAERFIACAREVATMLRRAADKADVPRPASYAFAQFGSSKATRPRLSSACP
jgi:DNA-binding transcriptional LysR family regulator